jgi:predicted metal-dependent HD superfamily phosphohydrolase
MGEGQGQRDELRERWERACAGAGSAAEREAIFRLLYNAYTGDDRFYHGIEHIADCLRALDGVRDVATNPRAIELAIWFHDVIYDGRRIDNEERSAQLAQEQLARLGIAQALRDEVHRLILLTRHDREPGDIDGRIMVDIDLASLALPAPAFDENSRLIRREYAHVPEVDFLRGRQDMLGRFLARPHIYYTDVFRSRYESDARQNLSRVLAAS